MSTLPTHRDPSASSSSREGRLNAVESGSSSDGTSTQIGQEDATSNDRSKKVPGQLVRDQGKEYLEKGLMELEEDGQKRKVMLVVEQKSGKEMFKEVSGGPNTQPRWRHSLPFIKPKHPPPPAPLSLDDPEVTPEATAGFFSLLFFNWISPMMALGSARPLQPTDLWKMDEARSAGRVSNALAAAYLKRVEEAKLYNENLLHPSTPLPFSRRILYGMLPQKERREKDYRTKWGKKKASLAWSLNDVFGRSYWIGGVYKVLGDVATATTPLVLKAIIAWCTQYQLAKVGLATYPDIGHAIGMAFGLLAMLVFASLCVHHYFVRSMTAGVLLRAAIISGVYDRALRLTQKARGELPNGKIVNHISTDTSRIDFAASFFTMMFTAPVQFIVIMIILLVQIGYSALPGIAFLLIMTPAQMTIMKKLFGLRKKSMFWTDKRAKLLQEILGGMRIVKFMAWEKPFLERIGAIRSMEISYVRTLLIYRSGMMAVALSLPVLAAILSFVTYSLTAHDLQAATIFTVITLFQLMRMPLMMWPMTLSATADARNALSRLEVVYDAEVITEGRHINPGQENGIQVDHASFTWDAAPIVVDHAMEKLKAKGGKKAAAITGSAVAAPAAPTKPSKAKWRKHVADKRNSVDAADRAKADITGQHKSGVADAGYPGIGEGANATGESEKDVTTTDVFKLHDINLSIPKGSLTAIVGAIGSGKSSLLQGLMGEMRKTDGKVTFSGSTALCAQTPWIQNATVRENITFGQPWDEERYWAAVRDACLEPDLELLQDGDSTEIGEKGINLSGGQKQRVNIARAIYFDADIIALDDPLSALDAGVGKALFFNAILDALSGKTRVLVTHALHFLPYVDNIITIEDGRVAEQGTYNELKARGGSFSRLIRDFGSQDEHDKVQGEEEDAVDGETKEIMKKHDRANMVARGTAQSLMQQEERNSGALSGSTWVSYAKAGKGLFTIPALLSAVAIAQGFFIMTSFWLVYWQERRFPLSNGAYMAIYAALGIGSALSMFFQGFSTAFLNYFASVKLHKRAAHRIMFAPQSFFDTTPLGRIMNRFSKDIDTVDNTLGDAMRMAVGTLGQIMGATILIAIIQPYFLIAMFVVTLLYAHNAKFYRKSSREFKRIDAILRSSLYSHFSESLSGIATIRSYGESEKFCDENVKRMDVENRAYYLTIINQRWLGVRLDILGSVLSFVVAIIVISSHNITAAEAGLGLSTMISVQQSFSWLVRQLAEVENDMVGTERVLYYANELDQEALHTIEEKKPQAPWPSQGRIEFNDVRMRYRPELPDVLQGLSMSVGANEKVGVVGRTGAGKSSIMISLFRMAELSSGSISIDGVDVSKIGLNDLRTGISIIPQDPLLFSGTLRSNIDPFNTKTDAELYDALKRAHLVPSSSSHDQSHSRNSMAQPRTSTSSPTGPSQRFTLDTVVEEEGGNLSVGERSLVSLARAMVRNSKVLVLDEATASVDVETDSRIQETIRNEFRDKTLLCIAHRLRTILSYDKILVMADGKVAEFDTPEKLFKMNGIFKEMAQKSSISLEDIRAAAALHF